MTAPVGHADRQHGLYTETEHPGQPFDLETHAIIRHRYHLAAQNAAGRRVLEIGAGAGLGLSWLGRSAAWLVAGEYTSENIAFLRARGDQVPTVRFDATAMPFTDGSFDMIAAMAMVYYLPFDELLRETHRVLAPGGILFFCTSNKNVPGFWPAPYTTRYYAIPELERRLREHGFDATFHGAFPAAGPLWRRWIRASIKDTVKRLVLLCPGGMNMWKRIRRVGVSAEPVPLPNDIERAACGEPVLIALPGNRRNRTSRVIYVTARRRQDASST